MIEPKNILHPRLLPMFQRAVLMAGMLAALSACALMPSQTESSVLRYEYQPTLGFVRLERIEAGAPDNAHPFVISVGSLRQLLARLKVAGSLSRNPVPVFNDAELTEFTPPLVTALSKAGPTEDVSFAVTGKHGQFGQYSPSLVTTGRLFVRDGKLNLIVGLIHEPYENGELGAGKPAFTPGARGPRIARIIWSLVPENAALADKRADWLLYDVKTLPAAAAPPSIAGLTSSAPTTDSRADEIENKLAVLDRLKAKGAITEDEYRERRRAILAGI